MSSAVATEVAEAPGRNGRWEMRRALVQALAKEAGEYDIVLGPDYGNTGGVEVFIEGPPALDQAVIVKAKALKAALVAAGGGPTRMLVFETDLERGELTLTGSKGSARIPVTREGIAEAVRRVSTPGEFVAENSASLADLEAVLVAAEREGSFRLNDVMAGSGGWFATDRYRFHMIVQPGLAAMSVPRVVVAIARAAGLDEVTVAAKKQGACLLQDGLGSVVTWVGGDGPIPQIDMIVTQCRERCTTTAHVTERGIAYLDQVRKLPLENKPKDSPVRGGGVTFDDDGVARSFGATVETSPVTGAWECTRDVGAVAYNAGFLADAIAFTGSPVLQINGNDAGRMCALVESGNRLAGVMPVYRGDKR